MPEILDLVAVSPVRFRPRTVREFFAIQLARKLGDQAQLRKYLLLVEQCPQDIILRAFRKVASQDQINNASGQFSGELERLTGRRDHEQP